MGSDCPKTYAQSEDFFHLCIYLSFCPTLPHVFLVAISYHTPTLRCFNWLKISIHLVYMGVPVTSHTFIQLESDHWILHLDSASFTHTISSTQCFVYLVQNSTDDRRELSTCLVYYQLCFQALYYSLFLPYTTAAVRCYLS